MNKKCDPIVFSESKLHIFDSIHEIDDSIDLMSPQWFLTWFLDSIRKVESRRFVWPWNRLVNLNILVCWHARVNGSTLFISLIDRRTKKSEFSPIRCGIFIQSNWMRVIYHFPKWVLCSRCVSRMSCIKIEMEIIFFFSISAVRLSRNKKKKKKNAHNWNKCWLPSECYKFLWFNV